MIPQLTIEQIEFLKSFEFIQKENVHGNYFFRTREDSDYDEFDCIIPQQNSTFKLESYGTYPDGDGGYDNDYSKTFSKVGQSLEDFITEKI